MKVRIFTIFSMILLTLLPLAGSPLPTLAQPPDSGPAPLLFIENAGQFDAEARFQVQSAQGSLWLAENALWVTILEKAGDEDTARQGCNLRFTFEGAKSTPRLEPFNRLDTHLSYFIGNDPAQWRTDVAVWGGVRYLDLYPGMDLEVSGADGKLTLRWIAQEDADLDQVRLRVEGGEVTALEDDHLRLTTAAGAYSLPLIQVSNLQVSAPKIAGALILSPFRTPSAPVTHLAPQASAADLYSTFLGGSANDEGWSIAVDSSGAAYVTGNLASLDLPTTSGAFHLGTSSHAFVVKLAPSGSHLLYAAFFGGTSADSGYGIMVDTSGAAYVTGNTTSVNFPTTAGAFDTSYNDGEYGDAFALKLNPTGTALNYATYLGGSNNDFGQAIALRDGAAYITGYTGSANFPATAGAFDANYNGGFYDVFVLKLNATGTALHYATFLGGSEYSEYGQSIAVDSSGAAYLTGYTLSGNFPATAGAYDASYGGGSYGDVFVTKLNPTGSALTYSTFLGGSDSDNAYGIAIDSSGAAYVTGYTASANFPSTAGAYDANYNSGNDAFVAKLNPTGTALGYATFLGGSNSEKGYAIAVDASGAAYLAGETSSSNFPITLGAFDSTSNGSADVFITSLNPAGSALTYATYLGGSTNDYCKALAIDATGAAYVVGHTYSSDFPTLHNAFDASFGGGKDVFVSKLRKLAVGVDGVAVFAAPLFDAAPGKIAAIRLYYTNYGSTVGTTVDLVATLDSRLTYVPSANALYDSVTHGNQVTFYLNTLYPLSNYELVFYVRIPADAIYGTRYPISAVLSTQQADIDPSNNTPSTQVMATRQIFVPVTAR